MIAMVVNLLVTLDAKVIDLIINMVKSHTNAEL
jgi:hypothetical protein